MHKPIPKGYKDTSLGIIPKEWEVKRLDSVCDFTSGGTPSKDVASFWSGNIPWISASTMHDQNIHTSELCISEEGLRSGSKLANKGDLLLLVRGSMLWNRIPVCLCLNDVAFNQDVKGIKANHLTTSIFLLYFLLSKDNILLSKVVGTGIGAGKLETTDLKQMPIALPPLPEQQKIAEILSCWDEAIEKQGKLVEQLERRKRALMQQLLTGKKRLKGFSGDWKMVRLGDVCERVTRRNAEDNKNVVTISAQRGFVSQTDFFKKPIASEIIDNYYLVEKDEFCYNKSYCNGYPMGAIKRLKGFEKAVVTTLYICFSIKNKALSDVDYFEHFFEAGSLNNGLKEVANEGGRAHGLLNVTPSDFFNLKMRIPSPAEQVAISIVIASSDKEGRLAKKKLEMLRSQKNALMQQLLTGKTRVKI